MKLFVNHVSLIVSNKNGQINFDDDDHNLMINGNKNHLTNLFINILDNSVKYSVLPPNIQISINKSYNMVSISPIKMELMVVTYGKNAINKDYTK